MHRCRDNQSGEDHSENAFVIEVISPKLDRTPAHLNSVGGMIVGHQRETLAGARRFSTFALVFPADDSPIWIIVGHLRLYSPQMAHNEIFLSKAGGRGAGSTSTENSVRPPHYRIMTPGDEKGIYAMRASYAGAAFWLSQVPAERFESFWTAVAAALAPGGRVFFADDRYRTPEELIEGAGTRAGPARRGFGRAGAAAIGPPAGEPPTFPSHRCPYHHRARARRLRGRRQQ